MKLNPEDFQCVKKLAGTDRDTGLPIPPPQIVTCDHVWVHLNGQNSKCAKCGVQPKKVVELQDAYQALQEKKDVIENKKNKLKFYTYEPNAGATVPQEFYKKGFLETLKKQTPLGGSIPVKKNDDIVPLNVPKEPEFKGAGAAEMFVKKIAVMSNLNVDLQGKGFGWRKQYRLHCDKCGQHQDIETAIADRYDFDHPSIATFCKVHRHDPVAVEVVGRKFRE